MSYYEVLRIIVLILTGGAVGTMLLYLIEHVRTERMIRRFMEEKIENDEVDMHVVTRKDLWEDDGK